MRRVFTLNLDPIRYSHLIGILILATMGTLARADVVYTYTGNPFTSVLGSYTTSDFVSVSFTLATPLGPNFAFAFISPTDFTFSDGQQTFTQSTPMLDPMSRSPRMPPDP
jgi:hypothetical protein